jgi:hypothetical protein
MTILKAIVHESSLDLDNGTKKPLSNSSTLVVAQSPPDCQRQAEPTLCLTRPTTTGRHPEFIQSVSLSNLIAHLTIQVQSFEQCWLGIRQLPSRGR